MNLIKIPDIIIVDDHLIFRQGLISIFCNDRIANVVGSASNGVEFLELLTLVKPDLVLMDIDMPRMNGLLATRKALELIPGLKIIAFTMFEDEDCCLKMIELGVKGYLLKSNGLYEIENAIQKVMKGGNYFPVKIMNKIFINLANDNSNQIDTKGDFTESEKQMLQKICHSLTTLKVTKSGFNLKDN